MKSIDRKSMVVNGFILMFFLFSSVSLLADENSSGDVTVMTLEEAEQRIIGENPQYRIEKNQVVIASENRVKAFSYFLPEFSLFAGYAYMDPPMGKKMDLLPGVPFELTLGQRNNTTYGAQMDYLLFAGGKKWYSLELAELQKEASLILLQDTRRTSLFAARSAFFRLLLLREVVDLARDAHARSQERLKLAKARYQNGNLSRVELLKFQTDAKGSKILLGETDANLTEAMDSFRILLGMDHSEKFRLQGSLDRLGRILTRTYPDPDEDVDVFPGEKIAAIRKKQSELKLKMEKSDFWPSVFARLQYDHSNPYLGQNKFGDSLNFQVRATFPLYQGGRQTADTRIAEKEAQNAKIIEQTTSKTLKSRYRVLARRLETLASALETRSEAVKEATAIRDATAVGWKNGAATHSDLSDADLLLQKKQVEYYTSLVEIVVGVAEMERISGKQSGFFEMLGDLSREQK